MRQKCSLLGIKREVQFVRDKKSSTPILISSLQADRYLRQCCVGYLAYMLTESKKLESVAGISIVEEFPEVFLDELPRMPPSWDIDFTIDLLPGTAHIS